MSYLLTRSSRLPMTSGRVVALAIGVPVAAALIVLTGFSLLSSVARASFPVAYRFPVSHGRVTARIDGDVTLRQAAVRRAELKGIVHYGLFRPTLTEGSGTVGLSCGWSSNCSLDGTLEVPQNTAVSLSSAGGDVSLGNYAGDRNLTVHSDGGNVSAGHLTGGVLSLWSAGGDVSADSIDVTRMLQLTSEGGNVSAGAVIAPAATITSVGGDVSMTFIQAPGSLSISSFGGNVTLVLPPGDYAFNVSSDGGNASYPTSDPRAADKITVHSTGGDVTVSEAG